ncbi:hypothetical protein EJ110_NYTH13173 [Nymphaea thermarum]|nr:hypothetical protein EJ110_NYTH13173 [Nymphaea thermarum]
MIDSRIPGGAGHWALQHAFPCRIRFSYKNAAALVCFFNIVIAILLLHAFFGSSGRRFALSRGTWEAEALRRAMEPLELIKRVKEIQEEFSREQEIVVVSTGQKQSAASDLSKRLKDFQALNDANSKKGSIQ